MSDIQDLRDQLHRERVRLQTQINDLAAKVEDLETRDDAIIARIDNLAATRGWEPTPPAAPEPDDAASERDKWGQIVEAGVDGGFLAARDKAIELGLAAPADRAVTVTDAMVEEGANAYAGQRGGGSHEYAMRYAIEAALRAADRAVTVTDDMVEAALNVINPHIITTKRVVSCDLMERAIEAALRAAERGEGE
jgi:hypothetical protein